MSDKETISYETAESTVIRTWKTMLKNTNQYLVPILLPVVEHFKPLFKEFYDLGVDHGKTAQVPEGFVLVEKKLIKTLHEELLDHEPDSFVVIRDICELWEQAEAQEPANDPKN